MNKLTDAIYEITNMNDLERMDSAWHRVHPFIKLVLTLVYIITVISFPGQELFRIVPLVLYPILIASISGIPVRTAFRKMWLILLLVLFVGVWNPILDKNPYLMLGTLTISKGMVTFVTLAIKGVLALLASFYLIATTGIEGVCYALRCMHVPSVLVTLVLITYRYIHLIIREAEIMTEAYALRAPGHKGIHISAWGSFLGQLLIRCMDRAEELYQSMLLRGYCGQFYDSKRRNIILKEWILLVCGSVLIVLPRIWNLTLLLGNLVTGQQ